VATKKNGEKTGLHRGHVAGKRGRMKQTAGRDFRCNINVV